MLPIIIVITVITFWYLSLLFWPFFQSLLGSSLFPLGATTRSSNLRFKANNSSSSSSQTLFDEEPFFLLIALLSFLPLSSLLILVGHLLAIILLCLSKGFPISSFFTPWSLSSFPAHRHNYADWSSCQSKQVEAPVIHCLSLPCPIFISGSRKLGLDFLGIQQNDDIENRPLFSSVLRSYHFYASFLTRLFTDKAGPFSSISTTIESARRHYLGLLV